MKVRERQWYHHRAANFHENRSCNVNDKIVIFNTCGSAEEADRIARKLVDGKLAACVNVITPVRSYYHWQGKLETAEEWMLVIKSTSALFIRLREALEAAHSYQIPELIAIPITDGSPAYLNWMEGQLA